MKRIEPIIFIGMHRSGTSMLVRLMENFGLFIGTRKEKNDESIFFQKINQWILRQCGARWDNPAAIEYLLKQEDLLRWIEKYVIQLLNNLSSIHYLGIKGYMKFGGVARLTIPWGWKDPRNTFTLPIWLRLFPDCKVVNIKRHGVDVAQSLKMRNQQIFLSSTEKFKRYKWAIPFRPKKGGFNDSPRCAELEGGLSLWREYVAQAEMQIRKLPEHRVFNIRYEDMLHNPVPNLSACAEFCGLEVNSEKLKLYTLDIDPNRAYAYKKDSDLLNFCERNKDILSMYGYY